MSSLAFRGHHCINLKSVKLQNLEICHLTMKPSNFQTPANLLLQFYKNRVPTNVYEFRILLTFQISHVFTTLKATNFRDFTIPTNWKSQKPANYQLFSQNQGRDRPPPWFPIIAALVTTVSICLYVILRDNISSPEHVNMYKPLVEEQRKFLNSIWCCWHTPCKKTIHSNTTQNLFFLTFSRWPIRR